MIACVSPDFTVRSTPLRISVVSSPSPTVTCRSRISRTDMRLLVLQLRGETEAGLDRGHDLPLQIGNTDPLDDVGEEAAHHEPAGLVFRNAARLQVEQLQIVEASGGARVS